MDDREGVGWEGRRVPSRQLAQKSSWPGRGRRDSRSRASLSVPGRRRRGVQIRYNPESPFPQQARPRAWERHVCLKSW